MRYYNALTQKKQGKFEENWRIKAQKLIFVAAYAPSLVKIQGENVLVTKKAFFYLMLFLFVVGVVKLIVQIGLIFEFICIFLYFVFIGIIAR